MTIPHPPRFSARPGRSQPSTVGEPYGLLDQVLTRLVRVGSGPQGREALVASADVVLTVLRKAAEGEHWQRVLELARVAEPAFAGSTRWGAWERVLQLALQASRAIGDRSAEGWALHQLGIRALAMGDEESACSLLSQALAIRDQTGPEAAAELTASQLRQLAHQPAG